MKNDSLHSKSNVDDKMHYEHLNEQLLDFKCNADSMLHYGDRSQIDCPKAEIPSWTRARKSRLLNFLHRWNNKFLAEALLATRGQRSLLNFGFTAERRPILVRDLDDPSTGYGAT